MIFKFCDAKLRMQQKRDRLLYYYYCIMGKIHSEFFFNLKVITGELQHNLVAYDVIIIKKKTE